MRNLYTEFGVSLIFLSFCLRIRELDGLGRADQGRRKRQNRAIKRVEIPNGKKGGRIARKGTFTMTKKLKGVGRVVGDDNIRSNALDLSNSDRSRLTFPWQTLFALSALKAMLIPSSFKVVRFVIPKYASVHCLLRLVNETAPQHYENHPFWKDLTYDDSCEDLADFVLSQFDRHNEFIIFITFAKFLFVAAIGSIIYNLLGRNSNVVISCFKSLIPSYFTMALLFMGIHFSNDNTWFCGNIMHHADISEFTSKSNASTVDTIPQGFLLTYMYNIAWMILCVYAIHKCNFSLSVAPISTTVLMAEYFKWFLKNRHTAFHDLAKPEWQNALPFSFKFKAYHHVFVHHHDGDSFGSSAAFDGIFSIWFKIYSFAHNIVFNLEVNTVEHYLFAVVADTIQSISILLLVFGLFYTTHAIYDRTPMVIQTLFSVVAVAFFLLTVGALEDEKGDFHWPLEFFDERFKEDSTCSVIGVNITQ